MNKIICPIDFSATAMNAVEYAAKTAQALNAEVKLLNVQGLYAQVVPAATAGKTLTVLEAEDHLQDICAEVSKTFHISCTGETAVSPASLASVIGKHLDEDSLLVMGTNGADTIFQFYFGSHGYRTLKRSPCPVILVPQGVTYGTVKKAVIAWDYSNGSKSALAAIRFLHRVFNAEMTLLHISQEETSISTDVFRALKEGIPHQLDAGTNVHFTRIVSPTIADGVDQYMRKHESPGLLMLTLDRHGSFLDLAAHPVLKQVCATATYPVMVVHTDH
jgi:nucleotide-binding universal stress UspA family protein